MLQEQENYEELLNDLDIDIEPSDDGLDAVIENSNDEMGLTIESFFDDESGKYGFISLDGTIVYQAIFDRVETISSFSYSIVLGKAHATVFSNGYLRGEWIETNDDLMLIYSDESYLNEGFISFLEEFKSALEEKICNLYWIILKKTGLPLVSVVGT